MIKLFERSMVLQVVLVLVALALLWFRPIATPPPMGEGDAVLYNLLHSWIGPVPRLAVILAMVIVLAEGFGLNLVLADIGLVSQNSLFPTLLYILLASSTTQTLTPTLLVAGVMIICTRQLMLRGTLLTINVEQICTVTSLIGLCTMLYVPSVLLMASYLLIAVNYRLYNINDIAVMILGFLSPYVVLLTVLLMTDGIGPWWESLSDTLGNPGLHFAHVGTLSAVCIAVLVLAVATALVATLGQMGDRTIVWKMNASTVMLLFVGGAAMLLYSGIVPPDMTIMAIPFAFCGTQLLLGGKRATMGRQKKHIWYKDIILTLIIIASILC